MRQKPLRKRVLWYLAVDRMLKGAAAIHYTTDEERRLAESSLGLEKGVVIPLGITLNEREQGSDGRTHFRHERLGQRPYVLTLSRLHPKKNIEVLIEAFLSLAEQRGYGDWRLVIAGDGEPRYVESLERLVKERGGEERVLLVGWLGGEEKRAALEGAALLALPSHQENFGIAAAEALAAAVPVLVSAQVNLAPEIAARGAGWVTSLDKSEIARTLAEALGDAIERRRRGQAGRRFVAQRLSWERLAADLVRLYATLCGGEARPKAQYSIC
jgi:glycosyltransferase involved in cell wall biosynthesis